MVCPKGIANGPNDCDCSGMLGGEALDRYLALRGTARLVCMLEKMNAPCWGTPRTTTVLAAAGTARSFSAISFTSTICRGAHLRLPNGCNCVRRLNFEI